MRIRGFPGLAGGSGGAVLVDGSLGAAVLVLGVGVLLAKPSKFESIGSVPRSIYQKKHGKIVEILGFTRFNALTIAGG